MLRDTHERYGIVSRLFHWGMALLVIWQAMKFFDRIDEGEHWIGQTLVPWHVSVGSLLLLLVLLRAVWALRQRSNRPVAPPPPLMAFLASAGHVLLYAALVLMPLTGIAILLGNGYPLTAFGITLVPGGEEIPWLATLGGSLHSPVAWLLLIMIIGHVGMALVHHFIKKDDVLHRML
ncbi:cytochrome b [Xanthomonadaceae bacterium JHOS43]|nr:cytochrome b [Xanthomonadaceae bacterium JHOS43]MCX7564013.1 cytochrome b [Xanthomonadaceae bacterium XH05]